MPKPLLSLLLFVIVFTGTLKAQKPDISYPAQQTYYFEKQAKQVNITNKGGAVPSRYATQAAAIADGYPFGQLDAFVTAASGDIYVAYYRYIFKIKPDGTTILLAGNKDYGSVDGTGAAARFNNIIDMAIDQSGNIFVAENNPYDYANCKVRKVTPAGVVTTYASGLYNPSGIAVDKSGVVYVSEVWGKIIKISADKKVSLFAGQKKAGMVNGAGAAAVFNTPQGLSIDNAGNIYVADVGNNLIRKITTQGLVSTFAGTLKGASVSANGIKFDRLKDVACDSKGYVYVADGVVYSNEGYVIRRLNAKGELVNTIGPGFFDKKGYLLTDNLPQKIEVDSNDGLLSSSSGMVYRIYSTGYHILPILPYGLTFGTDGSITGTPTDYSPLTSYTVTAINESGSSTASFKLQVVAPLVPPVIDSISPASGAPGNFIQIFGKNFTGTTAVIIGGKTLSNIEVLSPTQIEITVPAGVKSGSITVVNPYGKATREGFILIPAPKITSFSPTAAGQGTKVTITGSNFTGANQIRFGGYSANSFQVISPTKIEAIVGYYGGGDGNISVSTPGGNAEKSGFTFLSPPDISGSSPYSGTTGDTITITGARLTNATSVKFGGVEAASFNVVSASVIKAVVGSGNTGYVSVTTPAGTINNYYNYFSFITPPAISTLSRVQAVINSNVYITGFNLSNAQVYVNDIKATVTYNDYSYIFFTVPAGATSGDIIVKINNKTLKYAGFIVLPTPAITSFSPDTAAFGDTVTIKGANLAATNNVLFGDTQASQIISIDSSTIKAIVGYGSSGSVNVYVAGALFSLNGFVHKGPKIDSLSAMHASKGDTIIITGHNFTGVTSVTFGGINAASFNIISDTRISAVVGTGSSGTVLVISPTGRGYKEGFTHAGPTVQAFRPAYAGLLRQPDIYITGTNFTGATSVTFGGIPAASFTVYGPEIMLAKPAKNTASGNVVVTTPSGIGTATGFIWVDKPTITSISPASQRAGALVTITGTNFYGVDSVTFGGKPANWFYANSPTSLTAQVGEGTTGNVSLTTVGGKASFTGFTYTSPVILSFSPTSAAAGQTVTITGTGLDSIKTVMFGNANAVSFNIVSSTKITAVVGDGYGGDIHVNGSTGSAYIQGFKLIPPPQIYSFTPAAGGKGSTITISGQNLDYVQKVKVGGVTATITSQSAYQLTAVLNSAASGAVTVNSPAGQAQLGDFTGYPVPVILKADPMTGNSETLITISGNNFNNLQNVRFGDGYGDVRSVSATKITVKAVNGKTGDISVTTPGGTAVLKGFKYIPTPKITSFIITGEGPTAVAAIKGSNLTGVTAVSFGGVPAKSFKVLADNSITAQLGRGASGAIKVLSAGGAATIDGFIYYNAPKFISMSPTKGPAGTSVIISGDNFNPLAAKNIVLIGQVKATVKMATKTRLEVVVPVGGFGMVSITNADHKLSGYSNIPFLITNTSPKVAFSNKLELKFESSLSQFLSDDFDGDGKPDLLVAKDDSLFVLRNSGDKVLSVSSFAQKTDLNVIRRVYTMTTGDINGDGKKDIVFNFGGSIGILQNTSKIGAVSFNLSIIEKMGDFQDEIILRDINADGKPDLIMPNGPRYYSNITNSDTISFGPGMYLKGDGGGTLSSSITDVDGDGKPEPIQSTSYGSIGIFKNNTIPGTLIEENFSLTNIRASGYNATPFYISVADFDGDGKVDIFEDSNLQYGFFIFRNKAIKGTININSFYAPIIVSNYNLYQNLQFADANSDGKIDLLSSNGSKVFYAANNSTVGNINFAEATPIITGKQTDSFGNLIFSDFDGDGKKDAATILQPAGYSINSIVIYNNSPLATPQITTVSPLTAAIGAKVIITGKYFDQATAVTFGDKPAQSFTVVSPTKIEAVVGTGATGKVMVKTPIGSGFYTGFVFIEAPVITSFTSVKSGSNVNITLSGKNFGQASAVLVATTPALSFKVVSATTVTAVFKGGAAGYISIITPGGTAKSPTPLKADQAVKITAPNRHTYGDADFSLAASSTNSTIPLSVTTNNPKIANMLNGKLHIVAAGTVCITATQPGNTMYNAASPVMQTLVIDKMPVTITAVAKSKAYGSADAALTYNITKGKLVGNDKLTGLLIRDKGEAVGTYKIMQGTLALSNNYILTFIGSSYTITPKQRVANAPYQQVTGPVVSKAISPNGDGVNDVLIINGISNYPDNKFAITDVNGTNIYEVVGYDNKTNVFNGQSVKTHAMLKPGTYFYILDYKDNGEQKRLTGFIVIKY